MEPTDGVIALRLCEESPAEPERGWLPARSYQIVDVASGEVAGGISLRIGYTTQIVRYGGNIGYGVEPAWRGNHFAGRACKLLLSTIKELGMDVIWITCNPDNWPSRKTCEWLGATLVEIVDLPTTSDMYSRGERQKCRYRLIVY